MWWRRWHEDSDEQLDNAHLMRLAGRLARRVRASAQAHGIPVIDCKATDRKHQIAEDYLAEHKNQVRTGVFLILVARAPALVWKVSRTTAGVIRKLEKRREFVNHYSFHIIDPVWGHVTIKLSGHPPFGAEVILNGHAYVACAARIAGVGFSKEGNCFTGVSDPERLAQLAESLSQPGAIGRLRKVGLQVLCYGSTSTNKSRADFATTTRSTRSSTAATLFTSGARMDRSSTRWSIAPAPGWTSQRSAPCSAAEAVRTTNPATSCRLAKQS